MLNLCHKLNSKGDGTVGVLPPSSHNDIFRGYDAMDEQELTKKCTKCQEIKLLSAFSKDKSRKDGLSHYCRICDRNKVKSYVKANQKKVKEYRQSYYQANIDEIAEDRKRYYQENHDKISKRRDCYYQENKEEINHKRRDAYQKYPDKCLKRRKIYYWNNREQILLKSKKYRKTNSEKLCIKSKARYAANPEKHKADVKKYCQTEEGKAVRQKAGQKYRALKIGVTVEDFSPIEIFKRDNYICQSCGIKTRPEFKNQYHPKKPHLDHIIPLSLGGKHSKKNVQCLCAHCNLTKSNTGTGDQLRLFG